MKVVFFVSTSIVLFFFALSFIVQNPYDIKIYYYFGTVWDGPVATLLLITLGVGILFGVVVGGFGLLKLKLRLSKVAKQLQSLQLNQSLERSQTPKKEN